MEVEYEPAGPKPIRKLSKDVVNQIAAAEVRPPTPRTEYNLTNRSFTVPRTQSRN